MRIALLGNAGSTHTTRWASALAERGHAVHLVSIRYAGIPGVSEHTIAVGPENSGSLVLTFLSYLKLLVVAPALLRRLKVDIVNAHYSITHGVVAVVAGVRPILISTWGTDIIGESGPVKGWRRIVNRFVLPRADAITVTSMYMRDNLPVRAARLPRVLLLPFGVDTHQFRASDAPKNDELVTIGFVKHLRRRYGPQLLIRAMEQVVEQLPEVRLVMAGDGPLLHSLERLVQRRGLPDYVHFLGRVPHSQVPVLMQEIDILVNPSLIETFGVVLLEAAATGTPVIATDVGGVPEIVDHGSTGILVQSRSVDQLAAAIVELARDYETRTVMGACARQRVCERYEWRASVEYMESVLGDLLADWNDGGP